MEIQRCGKCDNWMKKSSCPRERAGGKPNCNEFACGDFVLDKWYKNRGGIRDAKD